MKIETAKQLAAFHSHGHRAAVHYNIPGAVPLIGPLLLAVAGIADDGALWTTNSRPSGKAGRQLRFRSHGASFKLRWNHDLHCIVLQRILGVNQGPVLAEFRETDTDLINLEPRLLDAIVA